MKPMKSMLALLAVMAATAVSAPVLAHHRSGHHVYPRHSYVVPRSEVTWGVTVSPGYYYYEPAPRYYYYEPQSYYYYYEPAPSYSYYYTPGYYYGDSAFPYTGSRD